MKVAVLHGVDDIRLDEVEKPTCGERDIVIQVHSAGICGTDLHFRHMGPRFPNQPMPLGHEYAGEIVEVGSAVTSYQLGQRVAYNSNNSPADMGRGGECGGFSPWVILRGIDEHPQSLCVVPEGVSYDDAALAEPISVGAHAVNRSQIQSDESATIFGCGPIGLGIMMALQGRGLTDIVAFDLSPYRRELATRLGIAHVYDPRTHIPAKIISELRGTAPIWGVPHPVTDVYFEATGAPGMIEDIAGFCNKGSRIVTIAIHRKPLALDATKVMSKEISLIGAQGYPVEYPDVMSAIAAGSINPEAMVSHRFSFDRFFEAFSTADSAAESGKVLLNFEGSKQ